MVDKDEQTVRLIEYVMTCRKNNTVKWMNTLALRLNDYLEACNDCDRVEFNGDIFVIDGD